MSSGFRCFQAGSFIVIALILQASAVRAETVTLVCQNENRGSGSYGGDSFTLRVDSGCRKLSVWTRRERGSFRHDGHGGPMPARYAEILRRVSAR